MLDQPVGVPGLAALGGQVVLAVLEELAGGRVQGQDDVLAGLVAGLLDGLQQQVQGLAVAAQVGGEAALVADARWPGPSRPGSS